ncbi:putative bifunctional diguanylate cyclase/phosphodiesterase [Umezawaea beigongshangensis]|uniref:putative bifunctional diguanylate cyclase/phosphodiesterase n=1 Tax=Umezawaea beigongshangensis TaxID=2780383 RepID=UPI0018F1D45D|nr:EAL domain-containing protein [Umezawaea beigongshangensis]
MSSPFPDGAKAPLGGSTASGDPRRERDRLARKWAYLVSSTAYVPLSAPEIEQVLGELVDGLVDVLRREPFRPEAADALGARLVALHCVGPDSLRVSVGVLGKALLSTTELAGLPDLPERVVAVLGAFSSGYAQARQLLALEQQEAVTRALLLAASTARSSLRVSEARFTEVFASSPSGMAITGLDGGFTLVNEAFADVFGHTAAGLGVLSLFDLADPADLPLLRAAFEDLCDGRVPRAQHRQRFLRRDGEQVWASIALAAVRDEQGGPANVLVVVEDDSELALLGGRLTHQSLHDVLTGLPNRQFLTTQLEKVIGQTDPRLGATLYHLDLDAFSAVADGIGRDAGDQLLKHVAQRLQAVVAEEKAMVARLEGDEFVVLVENGPSTPDVSSMVDLINERLGEPVYFGDHGVAVSATVGVVHRLPRLEPAELLRASDLTLRRAKRSGRRQWGLYDAAQNAEDRAQLSLAAGMPGAWENGEITVVFQSVVALDGGAITALEAQMRWKHRSAGVIPHERCVALAEQTGLILPLGAWLLRTAAEQVRWWALREKRDVPVVVLLAASQARDPDLVGSVHRVLAATGLAAASLRLCVPARVLTDESGEAVENLTLLAEAGVVIEVRDFGGAADAADLEDLPVASVRVADRLVRKQAEHAPSPATTRVLTDLVEVVHLLGREVGVDGIATEAQAAWWRSLGADTATGPLYPRVERSGTVS